MTLRNQIERFEEQRIAAIAQRKDTKTGKVHSIRNQPGQYVSKNYMEKDANIWMKQYDPNEIRNPYRLRNEAMMELGGEVQKREAERQRKEAEELMKAKEDRARSLGKTVREMEFDESLQRPPGDLRQR